MRLVEIPDDGIVSEYIWAGDSVAGIRRIDLSYLPTIEAEPVRHGRWECEFETYGKLRCSVCKKEALLETANDALYATSNYCPHCGCKMDGDDDATN